MGRDFLSSTLPIQPEEAGSPFRTINRLENKADYSFTFNPKVRNEWRFTPPRYVF